MKPTFDTPTDDAKTKIIKAAVSMFAEHGANNVPLRELTTQAGVNIAAVNYYFGSRSALEEAVFEEVAIHVNKQRLAALKALLKAAAEANARPSLEAIIDTFTEPYLGEALSNEGALLAQLILKHRDAPTEMTKRLVHSHFDPMAKKYVSALALAIPHASQDELVWRYMFMTSTVVLTATDRSKNNRVAAISAGKLDAADTRSLRAALMRFLVGGMSASAESPAPRSKARSQPKA